MAGSTVEGIQRIRRRTRVASSLLALLVLVPPAAHAELSALYREWGEGPARHLMVPEELEQWKKIAADEEAERFIRLFWAQRDPDPQTADNEFRREFEERVAYADQRFETEETRGSMTDQGQVFILLGPPRRVQAAGAGGSRLGGDAGAGDDPFDPAAGEVPSGTGAGRFGRGGATDRAGVASEYRWTYEEGRVPEFVPVKRFTVRFLTRPGTDEIELRSGDQALGYMAEAKRFARRWPELTLADLPDPTASDGDDSFFAWRGDEIDAAALPGPLREAETFPLGDLTAHLDAGAFQAGDGRWIVPLQVSTTAPTGEGAARVVGELSSVDGDRRLCFRFEEPWRSSKGLSYVRDTLVVDPGVYELRAGLESPDGRLLWADRESVSVPEPSAELWLSELILSSDVFPMSEAQEMLEPYAWQGIAVVPKGDRTFAQGELLWFYLHACRPVLDEQGKPSLRTTIEIDGPSRFRSPVRIEPVRAGDHCWVLAQGLELLPDRFPAADYKLTVQVRDSVGGTIARSAETFRVVEAGSS